MRSCRALCLCVFLFARNFLNKSAIIQRNTTATMTTRTTATSNESGPFRLVIDRTVIENRWNDISKKKDIVRSVAGKNFEFSLCQLGCTIFRSALPERRRHRVEFGEILARTLAACTRPQRSEQKILLF